MGEPYYPMAFGMVMTHTPYPHEPRLLVPHAGFNPMTFEGYTDMTCTTCSKFWEMWQGLLNDMTFPIKLVTCQL